MFHHPSIRPRASVIAFIALAALDALPCHAQPVEPLADLVQKQAEMLRRLDARVQELESQIAALRAAGPSTAPPSPSGPPNASGSASTTRAPPPAAVATPTSAIPAGGTLRFRGGPEWVAADGIVSAKLRGRLQSDFWGVTGSPSQVDYPSGSLVRAVRLGLEGRLNPVLSYVAEVDFGVGQVVLNDVYLQYRGKGPWFVRAGNIKPDFSLENMTGVHQTTFMERGLPNTFAVSDETLAIAAGSSGANWSFGATLFGDTPNVELDGDEGVGFSSRVTFAPVLSKDRVLHLGASAYRRHLGADAGVGFRVRQRPESRAFATRLVDTGRIDANNFTVLGAEIATVIGSWSLQGEYLQASADLRDRTSREFSGAYGYISWFATGESRAYNAGSGKFGRLKPRRAFGEGGPGAVEFGLRYSTLDLTDGSLRGGKEDNLTLGVNWYLSEFSKIQFNWVRFEVDDSTAVRPLGSAVHDGDALGMRVQVDW